MSIYRVWGSQIWNFIFQCSRTYNLLFPSISLLFELHSNQVYHPGNINNAFLSVASNTWAGPAPDPGDQWCLHFWYCRFKTSKFLNRYIDLNYLYDTSASGLGQCSLLSLESTASMLYCRRLPFSRTCDIPPSPGEEGGSLHKIFIYR